MRYKILNLVMIFFIISISIFSMPSHAMSGKEPLWTFSDKGRLTDIDISENGRYIIAGNFNGKCYLFGKESSTPKWMYTCEEEVVDVSISKDGSKIGVGSGDGKIRLFGPSSSYPIWTYSSSDYVKSIALSEDGTRLVAGISGYETSRFLLFDVGSRIPVFSFSLQDYARDCVISSNGNFYGISDRSDTFYFFSGESETPLWNFTADGYIGSISISSNGHYVTISERHKILVFHMSSSQPIWEYNIEYPNGVMEVEITSDGKYIIVSDSESNLCIFSIPNKSLITKYTSTKGYFYDFDVSSDASKVVAISKYGTIMFFEGINLELKWSYRIESGESSDLVVCSISPEGDFTMGINFHFLSLFDKNPVTPKLVVTMECPHYVIFGESQTLRISVKDEDGKLVKDAEVEVSAKYGSVIPSISYSDSDGTCEVTYVAPTYETWSFERITIKISGSGYQELEIHETIVLREEIQEEDNGENWFDFFEGFSIKIEYICLIVVLIVVILAIGAFLRNPPVRGWKRDAGIHHYYQKTGKYPRFPKK